ncbi:hypothetical protein RMATCC62417_17459 [Rhizopus microsporus]|nr:hypothetical protein RMATCC62417_17459 [Rhizopus microsporus]
MIPYLAYEGISQTPYSPLEKGKLARPLDEDTLRSTVNSSKPWSRSLNDADKEIIQRVQKIAEQRDALMIQVSIAWLLSKPTVISPIVGIGKESHLKDIVVAVSLKLTEKILDTWRSHMLLTYDLQVT